MFWILFTCCVLSVYFTLVMARNDKPEHVALLITAACAILEHVGRPPGEPRSVANALLAFSIYKILSNLWAAWQVFKMREDSDKQ